MSTTTKPRKPRAKSPLQADALQETWNAVMNARYGEDDTVGATLTATELGRASNPWRKLLSYLRETPTHPGRIEAEEMLKELGLIHVLGEFNSRTIGLEISAEINDDVRGHFFRTEDKNNLRDKPVPLALLAVNYPAWDHVRVLAANPKSMSWEETTRHLKDLGLTVTGNTVTYSN